MGFFEKLFKRKEKQKESLTIEEFWDWFERNEDRFLAVIKNHDNIEHGFINPVSSKLNQIQKGAFLLVGMMDDNTAEVIFSAEGNLLSFPYIHELVDTAPKLEHWKFTKFKPEPGSSDFGIEMMSRKFTSENIAFYPDIDVNYPDEISIKLLYKDEYLEEDEKVIENGVFIFLENYLGEIKTTTQIDQINFDHEKDANTELNPISKLTDYINWREKEFIEKYKGTFINSEDSNYSGLEWKKENQVIIGMCNSDLIKWDKKASHPWVIVVTIEFDKDQNNGMPSEDSLEEIYQFEDELQNLLPDKEGFLHVGQTTGFGKREIYYANKDFLKPIKVLQAMKGKVNFKYTIEAFKDKYWRSMNHFDVH